MPTPAIGLSSYCVVSRSRRFRRCRASMREDDLSRVLLVQACEQSDPEGLHLTFHERRKASREASTARLSETLEKGGGTLDPQSWIARRAAPLAKRL